MATAYASTSTKPKIVAVTPPRCGCKQLCEEDAADDEPAHEDESEPRADDAIGVRFRLDPAVLAQQQRHGRTELSADADPQIAGGQRAPPVEILNQQHEDEKAEGHEADDQRDARPRAGELQPSGQPLMPARSALLFHRKRSTGRKHAHRKERGEGIGEVDDERVSRRPPEKEDAEDGDHCADDHIRGVPQVNRRIDGGHDAGVLPYCAAGRFSLRHTMDRRTRS